MEEHQLIVTVPRDVPVLPETVFLPALLLRVLVLIQPKLIKLAVSNLYESVEEGRYGEIGRVVVDGAYLWSIAVTLIIPLHLAGVRLHGSLQG